MMCPAMKFAKKVHNKLLNHEIMESSKHSFYFIRDPLGHPRITVCIMLQNGNFHRGVSICSLSEKAISKKVGKCLAYKRAVKAMMSKKSGMPILRDEALIIQEMCDVGMITATWKSEYNIKLTLYENAWWPSQLERININKEAGVPNECA